MQQLPNNRVTLVIFTCQGREHLLLKTFESFSKSCKHIFSHKFLVIDGNIDQSLVDLIAPDTIIQTSVRKGYVNNILKAIRNIDSDYFFWLEDDWEFPYTFSFEDILPLFSDPKVLQVTFAKRNLDPGFKRYRDNIFINEYGFSANPSLCRTFFIRDIFDKIADYEKSEDSKFVSFEGFATDYSISNNLTSLLKYQESNAFINHLGDLESTAREYHMINSISIPNTALKREYISGLQREKTISLYNKFGTFVKLYIAIIYLSVRLFFSREAYDFAFRIYVAFLKRFKH